MHERRPIPGARILSLFLASGLLVAACSGGASPSPSPSSAAAASASPATASAAASASAAAACPSSDPNTPIQIGLISNLTGPEVTSGLSMARGAELAADAINKAGGVGGRQIKLIEEDSQSQAQAAIDAAHKLIDVNKVDIILMFGGSSLMIPVADYAKTKGVVVINTASSSPQLANYPGTLFSILPLDSIVGKELGQFTYGRGFKKAAVIVPNDAFGLGLTDAAGQAFTAAGGTIATTDKYTPNQSDYRADLQTVINSNPDVIISAGYGDDTKLIFKQARELGMTTPWYVAYPTIFTVENPDWMNGKLFGVDDATLSLKGTGPVDDAYKAKFNETPPTPNAYYSWDGLQLVAAAMAMGCPTAADVAKNLPTAASTFNGITGKIEFDSSGQRINVPLDQLQYTGGKLQLIP